MTIFMEGHVPSTAGPVHSVLSVVWYFLCAQVYALGFRTRMLGLNPNAAQYAGVNSKKRSLSS